MISSCPAHPWSSEAQKQEMAIGGNTRGVIITVYQESSASRENPTVKMIKRPRECSIAARPNGYDRRSQLLAYAHELRKSTDGPDWADWNSEPHPKQSGKCGWRWKRFRVSFLRSFRGNKNNWKYEEIKTENYSTGWGSRQRSYGRGNNKFWGKLKQLLNLKGLPFCGNCSCQKMTKF